MISLAPIRYSRILTKDAGPIERLEYARVEVCGRSCFQANAHLSASLNLRKGMNRVYGQADGTGTHSSAMLARHMAISEALERWAYYYTTQAGLGRQYGFDRDGTTTGMAAYPGLWSGQARKRALREAVERHCLVLWWNGDLGFVETGELPGGAKGILIENPFSRHKVVLVWRRSREGIHAYGYGAGSSTEEANWRAMVEMERSLVALRIFYVQNPGFGEDDLAILENHLERRAVYYSMSAGHLEFMARIRTPARKSPKQAVNPVVDTEIRGPWARYATVWRVLFPCDSMDHLIPQLNTFFW